MDPGEKRFLRGPQAPTGPCKGPYGKTKEGVHHPSWQSLSMGTKTRMWKSLSMGARNQAKRGKPAYFQKIYFQTDARIKNSTLHAMPCHGMACHVHPCQLHARDGAMMVMMMMMMDP